MDMKQIKQFLKLMNDNELTEISVKDGENSICLKKNQGETYSIPAAQMNVMNQVPATQNANSDDSGKEVLADNVTEITAFMVGTFYRASSPESDVFVEVGTQIKPGSVLCILEAMKLMNEVKSEISGKIVKILVENGQPVEFGQPLFLVEQ